MVVGGGREKEKAKREVQRKRFCKAEFRMRFRIGQCAAAALHFDSDSS